MIARYKKELAVGTALEADRVMIGDCARAIFSILSELKDESLCVNAVAGGALLLKDLDMFLNVAKRFTSYEISVENWVEGIKLCKFDRLRDKCVPN